MSEDRLVSACLLSWKRPQHLPLIVSELEKLYFIDEILIWNNNQQSTLQLGSTKTRIIDSGENAGCYGRYLCAARARNKVIYVQDDDVLISDIHTLFSRFIQNGTRLVHALSPWHFERRNRDIHGDCHMGFVGWGAFFLRDWLAVLDDVPEEMRASALFRREADKFFSILLERRHDTVRGRLRHLHTHSSPGIALWKEPEHREWTALAVREALRLVRERRSRSIPPLWHVVIPCHNYGHYLPDCVRSVVRNDADYALTIVDDGSSDETSEVAQELARRFPPINLLRRERSTNAASARNSGIAESDSAFVAVLDADDRLGPNYLFEAQRILAGRAEVANPDAILFGDAAGRWQVPAQTTLQMLLRRNSIHYCAGFRRSFWAQVQGFDERLEHWEDYDFWIRVAAAGARIGAVRGDHFYYRRHASSKSVGRVLSRSQLRSALEHKHAALYRQHGVAGRPEHDNEVMARRARRIRAVR